MVANAGIAQVKALLDLTEEDFRRMFEVNGTFCSQVEIILKGQRIIT
jgi:NAD(P)-dependent dehydrogenase (short-subunit alcohol dehydrogenase family)